MKKPLISPPKHLKTDTQAWFSSVVCEFTLEEHHVRILTLAAEAWDRCVDAREAITKFGLTYQDRFNAPHARPEVAIERDSRQAFFRAIRELGLDITEPRSPGGA